jgi:hypothetical protein
MRRSTSTVQQLDRQQLLRVADSETISFRIICIAEAFINAVCPPSAPCSTSRVIRPVFVSITVATQRELRPELSVAFTSAPLASSHLTLSSDPAATMSGVSPVSGSRELTSAPFSRRKRVMSALRAAATKSRLPSGDFRSAFLAASSSLTMPTLSMNAESKSAFLLTLARCSSKRTELRSPEATAEMRAFSWSSPNVLTSQPEPISY